MQIKDYLLTENQRNKDHRKLYTDILQVAFGRDDAILIAHHLTFDGQGDADEIPSADTMIFDHAIMCRVFPDSYKSLLGQLAMVNCDDRDVLLGKMFYATYPNLLNGGDHHDA